MLNINILFLDDDYNNHVSFKAIFREKYNIFFALNTNEAIDILSREKIDIFICDERMPDMNGSDFLKIINEKYPNIVNILSTAYTDSESVVNSINNGHIRYYISKPWDVDKLEYFINESYVYYIKTYTTQDMINEVNNLFFLKDRVRVNLLELKYDLKKLSKNEIDTFLDKIIGMII